MIQPLLQTGPPHPSLPHDIENFPLFLHFISLNPFYSVSFPGSQHFFIPHSVSHDDARSGTNLPALVAALVLDYFQLTADEMAEWEASPGPTPSLILLVEYIPNRIRRFQGRRSGPKVGRCEYHLYGL